jgi:hypothetical protein
VSIVQSALCFISYPVLIGLYRYSSQTLFFFNAKRASHGLETNGDPALVLNCEWKLTSVANRDGLRCREGRGLRLCFQINP